MQERACAGVAGAHATDRYSRCYGLAASRSGRATNMYAIHFNPGGPITTSTVARPLTNVVFGTVSEHFCLDLGTVDERATLQDRQFTAQSFVPMQCELPILLVLGAEGTNNPSAHETVGSHPMTSAVGEWFLPAAATRTARVLDDTAMLDVDCWDAGSLAFATLPGVHVGKTLAVMRPTG